MSFPIRVCLVGAGRAGKVHANSLVYHVPGAQAVALVDTQAEALQDTGEQFGVDARFDSLEAALDAVEFEAVVVTTPTFTHKSLAVMATGASKHVFLEKPMALTIDECDAIIAAAESSSVFLQLGFMRRFTPEFEAAGVPTHPGGRNRPPYDDQVAVA